LILVLTVRSIVQPISNLKTAAIEIAGGNLSYPIRSERGDEFGALSNCIGDMINKLVEYGEVAETLKAVEMASAAKSSFLAKMSHEIRTPMNIILGITEIQLRDETLAPDAREALYRIHASGDLLLSIINDILDLSKIEAGKLELSPREYETASLINDTVALNMMQIGDKPIEFVLCVDEDTPSTLIGDELRIKQILNNLLSNAFKYTEKGTVKLSVSSDAENESADCATLVFCVRDTGRGMTKEQVAKLFDEYARFDMEANRTIQGTGLGMSIARNLINMMHGEITVDSKLNFGTAFTVSLRQGRTNTRVLGKELAENLQNFRLSSAKELRKAQFTYEPMPYGSILIVDDIESNLYVAEGLLSPYGLSVDTAISGITAIERVKAGRVYDIIFMDHMMPAMDGLEATKKIRELGYMHPVVALTANAVAGQADIFIASGFDGFISKPIDMRQLYIVLKKFIRDKYPNEAAEAAKRHQDGPGEQKGQVKAATEQQLDWQLAEFFVKDAVRTIAALERIIDKSGGPDSDDMRTYVTCVHAMKSALANVGEAELSSEAAELEHATRDCGTIMIPPETTDFILKLQAVAERLSSLSKAHQDCVPTDMDDASLREKLLIIKDACESSDKKTAKTVITELRQRVWLHPVNELLGSMAEHLLTGDFDEAARAAENAASMVPVTEARVL